MAKPKKYALNNSYFKNRTPDMPKYPLDIVKYFTENGELPFAYYGEMDNWVYEMFCEYQKRASINFEQFLTPSATAKYMYDLLVNEIIRTADHHFSILEIGCGTGQITKYLTQLEDDADSITAIDFDPDMITICKLLYPESSIEFIQEDFTEHNKQYDYIITNPPYSNLVGIFQCLDKCLKDTGFAVLLLPVGAVQKERPKALVELLSKFSFTTFKMNEKFERTGTVAEISLIYKN